VLEFGGKKEKESWFSIHHQFIADIESRLGFLLRLRFRFRFWFLLVCDWVGVIFESDSVCFIVHLCCHCLLLYAILIFVGVSNSFSLF